MDLDLSICDDIGVMDGNIQLVLTHRGPANMSVDENGCLVPVLVAAEVSYNFCGILRQQDARNGGAVKQVYERGKSMSNEHVGFVDTYIEAPANQIPAVFTDDIITNPACGDQWTVVSFDRVTLKTRWKIACRKIV
jgi:hypothetical protein